MRRPLLTLAAAAVIGTSLVGCGGDDGGGSAGGCTPGPSLTIGATDTLKFDAERYDTGKGCVAFVYENEGSTAHTLLIKDVEDFKLTIGDRDEGAVELEPGTYTLYCDIAGHESAGMVAELTVA